MGRDFSVMDNVILELLPDCPTTTDGLSNDPRTSCPVIEALTLKRKEWAALTDKFGDGRLDISTPRNLLASNSTYYRALFSESFREAGLDRISVNWDRATFLNLLQFMLTGYYGISSATVVKFLEAATFFGVDAAIAAVADWTSSATLSKDPQSIKDTLQNLPYIWNTSNTLGYDSLSKFCPAFLAVNFVAVVDLSSFLDLPCTLLSACVAHPQLTVHSERQLCEALLRWLENQDEGPQHIQLITDHQPANVLSEVQRALLPKDFLLGRLRESNQTDISNSIIRITDYLEYLDLSGCYEVTDLTLFTSSARAPLRLPEHSKGVGHVPTVDSTFSASNAGRGSVPSLLSSFYNTPARNRKWPEIPTFVQLNRLNLTQCWRIPQDSLIIWLGEACPCLLELVLKNCPQITFSILQALPTVCPHIELVDISLDITDVSKEVQMYSIEENSSWIRGDASGLWRCTFSGLTQLSLRGHTEISDLELAALAVCSPPLLEIDLSMCTALTDGGIWRFLKHYPNRLKSFKAKGTAFGSMSCTALTSEMSGDRDSSNNPTGGLSSSERLSLTTLDLESCTGAKEDDLANVLRSQSALTHLSLGETNLSDTALSWFSGTSLQQLDVRETKVSGKALASLIRSNPQLKILDIRGCKRACIDEYELLVTERDSDPTTASHGEVVLVPLVFQELGRLERRVEDLKVAWRFGDSAQLAIQSAALDLQSLSVGIGGTITDGALQTISEHSRSLKQLSLAFQVITEEGLIGFLEKANYLHALELQYCLTKLSSRAIDSLSGRLSASLCTLKLERVAPWIVDSDIGVLSERCTRLSHLSLVGCRALTEESLKIIATNWRGLIQLKLEECNRLTSNGADCLLQSCGALEMLTLRHNGKGIAKNFIMDAVIQFPLLRHLSLDMCDSVASGFQTPNQVRGVLNTLLISRCKPHHTSLLGLTAVVDNCDIQSTGPCHKDTIVTQWNVDEAKLYMVKDRL